MTVMLTNVDYDVVIVGGGPSGLSFACSLRNENLKILVLEKSLPECFNTFKPDGREIALTHLSVNILEEMGVWGYIPKTAISKIKEAKIIDGDSGPLLGFSSKRKKNEALGFLVSNHLIRKALVEKIQQHKNIHIKMGCVVENVIRSNDSALVRLSGSEDISARLVIAADSRFSSIRRKMGIPSIMKDFSKVMIIAKMAHGRSHNQTALECFLYGRTVALLPLVGNCSSIIMTVSTEQVDSIIGMSDEHFNRMITQLFKGQLGQMHQEGEKCVYPLISVHAQTFISQRFALIGDAAVGMHPVTAHGFNLGLKGQDILAGLIKEQNSKGRDIGLFTVLKHYERKFIYLTRLLYFGTNGVVSLFTNDTFYAKPIRKIVLKVAEHFPPVKLLITQHLTNS